MRHSLARQVEEHSSPQSVSSLLTPSLAAESSRLVQSVQSKERSISNCPRLHSLLSQLFERASECVEKLRAPRKGRVPARLSPALTEQTCLLESMPLLTGCHSVHLHCGNAPLQVRFGTRSIVLCTL